MTNRSIPNTEKRQDPERFDPETSSGLLIDAEHQTRYRAAAQIAGGRRVLDAGCGTGYGTAMLAAAGPASLSAFDLAQEAVDATRSRVADSVEVQIADVHALPYADVAFDLVVCFEVLEHVPDQGGALAEFHRVLSPEGALLISSPNRLVYPPGNPHHVHELAPDELEAALREHFDHVSLYRQHVWLASGLVDDAAAAAAGPAPLAAGTRLLEPLAPGDETYTIAVASNGQPPLLTAEVALAGAGELQWFRDRITYLESHQLEIETARDDEIRRLLAEVDHARSLWEEEQRRRAALDDTLLDLESRNAVLTDLERRYAEVREERVAYEQGVADVLREKDEAFARSQAMQRQMLTSLSWRVTKPLRGVKRLLRGR
jgi:SAM-dependent methyltransferase